MNLVDLLKEYAKDPARMVREQFGVEPDAWQLEVLQKFPKQQRIALLACKGPGKSAVLTWLALNFLLTRPHPKIAVTSLSGDNLRDGVWTECAKWMQKSPLFMQMFEYTKTRIYHKVYPNTWYITARTWAQKASADEQAQTLAGLHADYIMFLLDESGGIPMAVMATADAALSGCVEGHILQAGNPTQRDGALYHAAHTHRRMWWVRSITGDPDDPLRTPRMSVEWAREQIAAYGRDSRFVRVNVFGEFPLTSSNVLIGIDDIERAMARHYTESDIAGAGRILGIDVARYGDDQSVVFPRQGLVAFRPKLYRELDGTIGGGQAVKLMRDFRADACFIDDTGGFGAAWIDQMRRLGSDPVGVNFSQKPLDPKYHNKRTEMYFDLCDWIKEGGQLPPADAPGMTELIAAITTTEYKVQQNTGRVILEHKEEIKDRLGYSPDVADALALTFAFPVTSMASRNKAPSHTARSDFDYVQMVTGRDMQGRKQAVARHEYEPY